MLTPEGSGASRAWAITPVYNGTGLSASQRSVRIILFARHYPWDLDCQHLRKGPMFRSSTAKQRGHIWNPASNLTEAAVSIQLPHKK